MRLSVLVLVLLVIPGCYESHRLVGDAPFTSVGVTRACATSTYGPSRDCAWRVDSTRTCVPGAALTVACGASCGIGSCSGDAMIRLCRGSADCTSSTALGSNDDSCGSLCPRVDTTCPAEGIYTVLTASYNSDGTSSCTVATR